MTTMELRQEMLHWLNLPTDEPAYLNIPLFDLVDQGLTLDDYRCNMFAARFMPVLAKFIED